MPVVFIAGSTGYLGRHLVQAWRRAGWQVHALVRDRSRAGDLDAHTLVQAQATQPDTLLGTMQGCDLVVSALGITRQRDGLRYRDVDYQANVNLLDEALRAGVPRFAYVHVLHAERMAGVPLVDAKQAFVDRLRAAPIASTVIAPSGYFSDMGDFLDMARQGRVWLFGDGSHRINPIHGADLAEAIVDAVQAGRNHLEVGGPEVFTQAELARLAFTVQDKPARVTFISDVLRRIILALLPWITPRTIHGPARFFLTAMGMDMVGERHGERRLGDAWREQLAG